MKEQQSTLSDKQIKHSRVIMGVSVLLLGAFLLLCALKAIPVPLTRVLPAAALIWLGLLCLILAFIQQNTLLLWLSPLFILSGIISAACAFTFLSYARLYPVYIISPAVSSFITALYSRIWKDHIKVIIFFALTAALFSLSAFFKISFAVVLPLFIIFLGAGTVAYAFKKRSKDE